MRGHGKSDYPSDPSAYSERHTIEDIRAILDATCEAGSKAVVGGLSLGGYMSLAFYRSFPERATALLIIDTGPGFKKDAAREEWNQYAIKTAEDLERNGLGALKSQSPERSYASHRDADGLSLAARGMLTQRDPSVIDSLPNIRVPSLVVVGAEDKPFLVASEYMARKIPGARKAVVPDAGHAVNIDQPVGFMKAVTPFLKQFVSLKSSL
jgi:pimeloyl-ACP methyl ester carboxylesterase